MSKVTKAILKSMREDMDKALAEVGEKYGFTISAGNASFDEYSFTFKVNGKATATEDGESVEKKEWDKYCGMYGLKPEHFGQTIETNFGQKYQILGLKPSSRKNPILLKDVSTGKTGVGPASWVMTLVSK